ncbi:Disease resistance protein [Quillaja saponaria]|uniref:Disease resistance protein n=1 Tax=Quillaja saponaria TaxID=32244 RepID=A0AAD7L2D8_QUISA|nr:Disease resistance protein [Quillaja saponaria]
MAAGVVGGAFLSAFLQVLFDRMASREVVSFIRGKKLTEKLLEKLKITLMSVDAVLDDAEDKEIKNLPVKKWLDELKDAVYVADDILDEISIKSGTISPRKVQNFISTSLNLLDRKLGSRIAEVLERLEYILLQKDALGLKEGVGVKQSQKAPTTSLVQESDVYGRHDDKEAIIKLLLSDDPSGNKICVIPIVGMGGIGKTTLAQLVYNNDRVIEKFELKAWVCVSEEFDVFRITKAVLEAVTLETCNITNSELLQLDLRKKLMGKKFLLVLDDIWNENYVDWKDLQSPFLHGALGSKMIVTTRNETVASIMRTIPIHYLKPLSDEECWQLFAKHAFDNNDFNASAALESIGRKIVKKCNGLPLAAKTLGGLLRSKSDVEYWDRILKSDIWELPEAESNVIPSLRLSYHYLPPHLKRCFAYCSIFPKDYEFEKENLILLWMAENLLQQPKGNKRIEEVGDEYFCELVLRSFFQQSQRYKSHFVMHDLINDLARLVGGKFFTRLEDNNSNEHVEREARHLSHVIASRHHSIHFEGLYKANRLRTYLQLRLGYPSLYFLNKVPDDLLAKLRCLRALSLLGDCVHELPDSLGKLRHLRYLDVSDTKISKLPESISNLYNLQTLKAARCHNLNKLPKDMHNLVNLRYLQIIGTPLEGMPSHLSKLRSLQQLSNFIVGNNYGSSIAELGKLSGLRGSLSVQNLKYVFDPKVAVDAKLKEKEYLQELSLFCRSGPWRADSDDSRHEKDVLDKLRPHTNLKVLSINFYTGIEFPKWLAEHSFCNLFSLYLGGCKYCCTLPSLGQLPSLKDLHIEGFDGIVSVGLEFYGNYSFATNEPFPSLEILRFENLSAWEKWCHEVDNAAFPCLRELYIENCPSLVDNLPSNLPSLTNLTIISCWQLASSMPMAPAIRELNIENGGNLEFPGHLYHSLESLRLYGSCDSLQSFPLDLFPNLNDLHILDCLNLQSLTAKEHLQGLTSVIIYKCPNFISFPDKGLPAPNLTRFEISWCKNLMLLPEKMHEILPTLKDLQIENCPEIMVCHGGGFPPNLRSLEIRNCDKLVVHLMHWNLPSLTSLTHMTIQGECKDLESFPEEGLLPASLSKLFIGRFLGLKTLDSKGLLHLTSLKKLHIFNCSKLESITEEPLPSSLINLNIYQCPLLQELCKREKGRHWPKILHIANIRINNELI